MATRSQPSRMPMDVPREEMSDETPSAITKLTAAKSPSQPAESRSSRPDGGSRGPANTVAADAVTANAMPRGTRRNASPAGRRAAKSARRERPVTTSSRKTPDTQVAGADGGSDEDAGHNGQRSEELERLREV